MIKYLTVSIDLIANREIKLSMLEKMTLSLLGVLTRKGKNPTDISDFYFVDLFGITQCHANRTLSNLQKRGFIKIYRKLGRRQIELTLSPVYEGLIYNFGIDKASKKVDK
jgi:hypothetical protein